MADCAACRDCPQCRDEVVSCCSNYADGGSCCLDEDGCPCECCSDCCSQRGGPTNGRRGPDRRQGQQQQQQQQTCCSQCCCCRCCEMRGQPRHRCCVTEPFDYECRMVCNCYPVPRRGAIVCPSMVYDAIVCPHIPLQRCVHPYCAEQHKKETCDKAISPVPTQADEAERMEKIQNLQTLTDSNPCPRELPYTAPPYGIAPANTTYMGTNRRKLQEGRVCVRHLTVREPSRKPSVQSAPGRITVNHKPNGKCVQASVAVQTDGKWPAVRNPKMASAPPFLIKDGLDKRQRGNSVTAVSRRPAKLPTPAKLQTIDEKSIVNESSVKDENDTALADLERKMTAGRNVKCRYFDTSKW